MRKNVVGISNILQHGEGMMHSIVREVRAEDQKKENTEYASFS